MNKISVVIAAFHAERWLQQCISSIRAQALPTGWELEILLGIDACASTLAVASTLAGNGVKVIALAHNSGPYITFNTLMQYAGGDVISRFDADDVMKENYVGAHLQALAAGADMTLSWSILTNSQLAPTSVMLAHQDYEVVNGEHRRGAEGQFMIKREVWQALGGFLPWRCGADTDFLKRVRAHGFQIEVIEKFLYYRRTHENSLTAHPDSNFQSEMRRNYIALMKAYAEEYKQHLRPLRIEPMHGEIAQILG